MEENMIAVYIKINEAKDIVEVISSEFLEDVSGYIKIDEGYGDRFRHAQSQYMEKELIMGDKYRYTYNENAKQILEKDQA